MKRVLILLLTLIFISCSSTDKKDSAILDNIVVTPEDMYTSILLDDAGSVNLFINNGFSVEYLDEKGESLLIKAIKNNSLEVMQLLIERGAALDRATYSYIRKNTDIEVPGKTPLYYVKSLDALDILIDNKANIDYVNSNGEPLIIDYIKYKPDSYIERLIDSKVNVNVADKDQWSPLIWASINGKTEIVKKLIIAESKVSFVDEKGNYAIYYTFNKEVISLLLSNEYQLLHKNNDGEIVLGEVYLKCVANSYYEEVEELLNLGVDVNYRSYGDTALSLASENKDARMMDILESRGAI